MKKLLGFTLIELMIVIAILGISAALLMKVIKDVEVMEQEKIEETDSGKDTYMLGD